MPTLCAYAHTHTDTQTSLSGLSGYSHTLIFAHTSPPTLCTTPSMFGNNTQSAHVDKFIGERQNGYADLRRAKITHSNVWRESKFRLLLSMCACVCAALAREVAQLQTKAKHFYNVAADAWRPKCGKPNDFYELSRYRQLGTSILIVCVCCCMWTTYSNVIRRRSERDTVKNTGRIENRPTFCRVGDVA